MVRKRLAPILALAALMAPPPARPEQDSQEGLRDQRFCELLLSADGSPPRAVEVYNTIGLNDCADEDWTKLTPGAIKAETKASFVRLNGPRRWTIDDLVGPDLGNPRVRSFEGLDMRQIAVVRSGVSDFLAQGPYRPRSVPTKSATLFKAGAPVFELIDPNGAVYLMQSFSLQVDPGQTMDALPKLAERLRLPRKWAFRTVTLNKDTVIRPVDGQATIVQDELFNTYQKSAAKAGDDL